ncbi:hypothetical protein [Streptomyces sp. NBC_01565]|uniref:hypothetical protein n=1 Tax=unclassified Streptomyces TaxID=2593676 RepID=UPI0022587053|nr:hypothetical protein [Streptomyces sp. NBC_01565]MCX4546271.1 hypothetical protein [Streptomyces sp. NBC_01565]
MTTALSYTLHTSPAPLNVATDTADGRAELRITVTNPGPDPVTCDTITVTVPAGEGPDALTATPETITARTDGHADWHAEHRGGGVFHIRPTAPGAELKPGERFVVTLDGVVVNRTVGTAVLGISEAAAVGSGSPRERAAGGWKLPKAPTEEMLSDFRPDKTSVPNGCCVTLTWKGIDGPDYTLFYDDQPGQSVNDRMVDGNGTWTSPALHTATAFMMLASTAKDGVPVTYGLTTAVTVDIPDLEVGSLDANGVVSLFGQAQEIAGGTESGTWTYRADTDGVITGYIKTNQSGAPATLNVFVTPPGIKRQKFASQSWDVRGGTENQEASVLVPVPRDSVVSVVQKTDGGAFTAALTWFPFGSGPLRVIEP